MNDREAGEADKLGAAEMAKLMETCCGLFAAPEATMVTPPL